MENGSAHKISYRTKYDFGCTGTIYACDFVQPVLLHTAQLFFLLEAAEHMTERAAETEDWHVAHAPTGLSLALMSTLLGETYNLRSEMGTRARNDLFMQIGKAIAAAA